MNSIVISNKDIVNMITILWGLGKKYPYENWSRIGTQLHGITLLMQLAEHSFTWDMEKEANEDWNTYEDWISNLELLTDIADQHYKSERSEQITDVSKFWM